jgi:hypothetical protein
MLRPLHMYWKHGGDDIDLGTGYLDDIPRTDELLSFVSEHGTTWRVVTVYRHMVAGGSMTHRSFERGDRVAPSGADLFVVPVDGPFEP